MTEREIKIAAETRIKFKEIWEHIKTNNQLFNYIMDRIVMYVRDEDLRRELRAEIEFCFITGQRKPDRMSKYYQCIGCRSKYKGKYLDSWGYDFCPNCGLELKGWSGK
ncbi:MAG: hypothetical protein ACOC4M_17110 [Promethearchaeia archaeon]